MLFENLIMLYKQKLQLTIIRSYWQQADTSWCYPSYRRPYNWLIHTLSGRGTVQLGNESIELLPNTLVVLPLNQLCHYRCQEPMKLGACAFTLELASGLDVFELYQPSITPFENTDIQPISNIIKASSTDQGYFSAIASMFQLLSPIIATSVARAPFKRDYDKIETVLSHIENNLSDEISIPQLAQVYGCSVAHFSRWFNRVMNVPPKKYINQKRMELACKKLLFSTDNIETIAYQCGFEDPLYFSKSFKNIIGSNPSSYRKTKIFDMPDATRLL